ncbi:MAG: CRISPR-associated endonuclease Cas2 [Hungateiclostridium thermocellum]|jgi:CRISPR-associated protein Cas2|nr:CRISPR-associated endonuclease Cas2 [Acetivibrio thermocellus]
MFAIMVYDIGEKRVQKILKTSRKYLYWVQNSVFEGEITDANYLKLKAELKKIIDEEYDSILFYTFRTTKYSSRENIGIIKGGQNLIL